MSGWSIPWGAGHLGRHTQTLNVMKNKKCILGKDREQNVPNVPCEPRSERTIKPLSDEFVRDYCSGKIKCEPDLYPEDTELRVARIPSRSWRDDSIPRASWGRRSSKPAAGMPWSKEDDTELVRDFRFGTPIRKLARRNERSVVAIQYRLFKLGEIPSPQWESGTDGTACSNPYV